jgi:DNA-binding transcriptional LysR family regulator
MNLDQLVVFLSVARHLHFSRAADELHLTQPAVSASVARLESSYGVALFHRIGRRVKLTDAGRFLQVEGQRLLERVDLLERGLMDFHALRQGELQLGASFTVGNYWLPTYLQAFHERYPGVALHCTLANAAQILEGTAEGRFDLGFVSGVSDAELALEGGSDLVLEQVGSERLQLVVGPGHPWFGRASLEPAQLRQARWVMREAGSGSQRMLMQWLAAGGLTPEDLEVSLVLTSSEMVKAVVSTGTAVAALPGTMVAQDMALGQLWPLQINGLAGGAQPIWMLKHPQRYQSQVLTAFEAAFRPPTGLAVDLPAPGSGAG